MKRASPYQFDWPVTLFLSLNTFISLALSVAYLFLVGWNPWIWILFLAWSFLTNLSITAGYHRLYAHRSYEAATWVKWLYLFFATSAWQGSAIQWANGHRVHHSEVDGEEDPYSIQKGFWFAHLKWMFFRMDSPTPRAPDLEKEMGLRFQHDHYIVLAIFCGYFVPALVGYWIGDFWGGLIILGGLRIVVTQQSTWFVNSLAHYWGSQTYTDENSARDNFIVALLTHGEGYHNFHHKFQIDYRNGVRWYHWDPTKWWIRALAFVGAASKLRRVQATEILKARLAMEARRLQMKGYSKDYLESLKERMILAQSQIRKLKEESLRMRQQGQRAFECRREELKAKIELQKADFRNALEHWKILLKTPVKIHG